MFPASVAFSYVATIVVFGVLYLTGDISRGIYWFAYATGVLVLRVAIIWAFVRRDEMAISPQLWARFVIFANFLAGVQWGLLGTWLYEISPTYRGLFTVIVIVSYVSGAAISFSPIRFAHAALAWPAVLPPAIYIFFLREDGNFIAGTMCILMMLAILYLGRIQHRIIKTRLTLEIENEALVRRMGEHNTTLGQDIDKLKHQSEVVKRAQVEARRRATVLSKHVDNTLLPVIECDRNLRVVEWNAAASNEFGYRAQWFGDRTLRQIITPGEAGTRLDDIVARVCDGGQPARADVLIHCANNHSRAMRLYITPIELDGKRASRVAMIATEIA